MSNCCHSEEYALLNLAWEAIDVDKLGKLKKGDSTGLELIIIKLNLTFVFANVQHVRQLSQWLFHFLTKT